jgi:ankyrin repeat protein
MGPTALALASEFGHTEIVVELLKQKDSRVDVNCGVNDGDTALILASSLGHEAIVGILLEHEALDVNRQNEFGHMALMVASRMGQQ